MTRGAWLAIAVALLPACGSSPDEQSAERQHTPGCRAPAGVSNQPRSIDETVELVNALPKPLTLPCFLEALARPLPLYATLSQLSAQPAAGTRSPRIFGLLDPLVFSVVPAGDGAHLLEFGEQRPGHRSLKGELAFPVLEQVSYAAPYEKSLFAPNLTGCAFCHADEQRDPAVVGAPGYVSQSLRPLPHLRVPLPSLRDEHQRCDPQQEPERCAMLDALFDWGPTPDWEFPPEMGTFGD